MGANGDVALSRIGATRPALSAWRFATVFGVVSLLADVVYEGARSITGPLLASLGATGLVVRSSPASVRPPPWACGWCRGHWPIEADGLGLDHRRLHPDGGNGSAARHRGRPVGGVRVGHRRASRESCARPRQRHPAVARGQCDRPRPRFRRARGAGPGRCDDRPSHRCRDARDHRECLCARARRADPARRCRLALLLWLQRRVPRPESYEDCPVVLGNPSAPRPWALPAQFWLYCGFTAITMLGFGTFGLLSFHMVSHGVLAAAMVPVVYAAAMAADALTALASGFSYDRYGAKTLAVLPILSILVVLFAFTDNVTMVVIGTLVWGAAVGIQSPRCAAWWPTWSPAHGGPAPTACSPQGWALRPPGAAPSSAGCTTSPSARSLWW